MKTLVVLIGVGCAGKTTLVRTARTAKGVKVLQPSTTRKQRADETDEYHFVSKEHWRDDEYAWRMSINGEFYGMRKAQIQNVPDYEIGVTEFHPNGIGALHTYSAASGIEVVTVGIDTLSSHDQLRLRHGYSNARDEGPDAFLQQRAAVTDCDAVFSGDQAKVARAFTSCIGLLRNRGVLTKEDIGALVAAGSLLTNADTTNIQPASYDLRMGSTAWCKGKTINLAKDEAITIPPYSYVIVQAHEEARLPKFVVAHYDLRVSLFVQGVLLSNGPQVDPGYGGALLCMLFNGSDSNVGIRRGEHFATIEFLTTSRTTEGYKEQHQAQERLQQFMQGSVAVGPGGTILDRFETLESRWETFRNAAITILVALIGVVVAASGTLLKWGHEATRSAETKIEELDKRGREFDDLLRRASSQLKADAATTVPTEVPGGRAAATNSPRKALASTGSQQGPCSPASTTGLRATTGPNISPRALPQQSKATSAATAP